MMADNNIQRCCQSLGSLRRMAGRRSSLIVIQGILLLMLSRQARVAAFTIENSGYSAFRRQRIISTSQKRFASLARSQRRTSSLAFSLQQQSANVCQSSRTFTRLFSSQSPDGSSRSDKPSTDTTTSNDTDDRTWKAIYIALQIYKAAYNDLKVANRFVVPDMKPWPKPCWGMKLGRIVAEIRGTGKYLNDANSGPIRRQQLQELGFVWRMRVNSQSSTNTPFEKLPIEQLYSALESYKQIIVAQTKGQDQNAWGVPIHFMIPDADPWPENVRGLPLGEQIADLKRQLIDDHPEMKDKFQRLGLALLGGASSSSNTNDRATALEQEAPSVNDLRFQNIITALRRYKELYGDLLVPQPFVVPKNNSDWPKETWELRLGARVNSIRAQGSFVNNHPERRLVLDELGFVWMMPKERTRRGRKSKEELEAEVKIDETSGPSNDVNNDNESNDDLNSLFDDSFDFEKTFGVSTDGESTAPTWSLDGESDRKAAAMTAAEAPPEPDYAPPRTIDETFNTAFERAKEVGIITGVTENRRVIKGKQEKYIPWFNDDFGDDYVFEDVVEALTIYKRLYGGFRNLTEDFVIPKIKEITGFLDDDDEGYDQFDVEASANAAVAMSKIEDRRFDFDGSQDFDIDTMRRMQEEAIEQSATVVVAPATDLDASEWPEHLAGWTLGTVVARIKDGSLEVKHLSARKEQLDAIGFDWGDPERFIDVPFDKAMCAFYAYYLIRGDLLVTEDFIMPDEEPWPEALAGYGIGAAVKRMRELQEILEAYHPDKVSMLRMVDFLWFPQETPKMDDETHMLYYYGHPDYAWIRYMPEDIYEQIHTDGPFFDVKDKKDRWREWHNWTYVADYWYQQGRRDNAYVLRKTGYPRMADEHEALYGPGMLTQLNATLQAMDMQYTDMSLEDKEALLHKLVYYRGEMEGCTDVHPQEQETIILDLESRILHIQQDGNFEIGINGDDAAYAGLNAGDGTQDGDAGEGDDDDSSGRENAYDDLEDAEFDIRELGLDDQ
ncbi:hypothetical protein MPSEU_000094600 [Mayamaea pseudoterrestris]|nr:hypothetical protein MPSEU_000094600 [Mayamaea pseudoterrestris]